MHYTEAILDLACCITFVLHQPLFLYIYFPAIVISSWLSIALNQFLIIGFRCHIGDEDYGFLAPCSETYVISQASSPYAGQQPAPAPDMAAALIGCIEPFDASTNDWETYTARLEQYLDANSIREEKKVSMLLTLIDGPTYQLVRNLIAPAELKTKSFDELTAALTQHFAPAPLAIAERYRFHMQNQAPGETVAIYVAELGRMAR